MSRRGRSDEPSLFDLPLVPEDEASAEPAAPSRRPRPRPQVEPEPAEPGNETGDYATGDYRTGDGEAEDDEAGDFEARGFEPEGFEPRELGPAELEPEGLEPADFEQGDLEPEGFEPPDVGPAEVEPAPPGLGELPLFAPVPPAGSPTGREAGRRRTAVAGARPPAGAAAAFDPEPEPEDAGFPFAERPPPHRPASPRPSTNAPLPAPCAASRSTARAAAPAAGAAGWDVVEVAEPEPEPEEASSPSAEAAAPRRAGLAPRLAAAAFDGAVLLAAAGLAFAGAALLDVRPGLAGLPGLAVLLLVFSFAYSVVPLAFWGATPGMRWAHLVARDRGGGPLTFGQTALRWLAGLLTVALAGLPMLLALGPLGARSPADRMSRSLTWRRRGP